MEIRAASAVCNYLAQAKRRHIVVQHCILRRCPSVATATTLLRAARTQEKFLERRLFVSATNVARVAKRDNVGETWSRQQCCRHNVSLPCRSLDLCLISPGVIRFEVMQEYPHAQSRAFYSNRAVLGTLIAVSVLVLVLVFLSFVAYRRGYIDISKLAGEPAVCSALPGALIKVEQRTSTLQVFQCPSVNMTIGTLPEQPSCFQLWNVRKFRMRFKPCGRTTTPKWVPQSAPHITAVVVASKSRLFISCFSPSLYCRLA